MRIVIDIPDTTYEAIKILGINGLHSSSKHFLREAFRNRKELPKGCGRLVDADKLKQCLYTVETDDFSGNEILEVITREDIDNAPTVIEADKEE